jgi:trehalose 2-sulfotransferase
MARSPNPALAGTTRPPDQPGAYIVASTPRTGSNLLCEGLAATRVAGRPQEFFAPDFRGVWQEHWGLDDSVEPQEYLATALRHGTSENGVVAFKIQWMHVPPLAAELDLPVADVLSAVLPGAAFVNTVRRDRLGQALSWFRAIATREWSRLHDSAAPPAPALDADAVRYLESHIAWQQTAWTDFFQRLGVVPFTVEYEALDCDYHGQIRRVLEFLGLDPCRADVIPPPRLARQADDVTARWRQRLGVTE